MLPTSRGALRRFARQLREAHLRATPPEAVELSRLERLVCHRVVSPIDAHVILRGVIRRQREREQT